MFQQNVTVLFGQETIMWVYWFTWLYELVGNWPKASQKEDLYINEEGMYELLISSQQPLEKEFMKRIYEKNKHL